MRLVYPWDVLRNKSPNHGQWQILGPPGWCRYAKILNLLLSCSLVVSRAVFQTVALMNFSSASRPDLRMSMLVANDRRT